MFCEWRNPFSGSEICLDPELYCLPGRWSGGGGVKVSKGELTFIPHVELNLLSWENWKTFPSGKMEIVSHVLSRHNSSDCSINLVNVWILQGGKIEGTSKSNSINGVIILSFSTAYAARDFETEKRENFKTSKFWLTRRSCGECLWYENRIDFLRGFSKQF